MPRKYRKKMEEKVEEANVLPVMNIMFLLIPALLMAMEVASMAAVPVSQPQFAAAPPKDPPPPKEEDKKPLKLKVFIQEDGFRVSAAGQQEGAAAGQEANSKQPTIGLKNAGAAKAYDRYDFAALQAKAQEFKKSHPHESTVTFSAESGIPMSVLVSAMDSMRGDKCKLKVVDASGKPSPDTCFFYNAVLESGAS